METWDSASKKALEQLFGRLLMVVACHNWGKAFSSKKQLSGCRNQKGNLLGAKCRVGP